MGKENPFLNADITKLLGKFHLPEVEGEALLANQRKNLEAATAVSQLAFEGFQSLAERQAELAKGFYESYSKVAKAVVEADTPGEKAAKQVDLVESLFEEAVSDLHELTDLTTKSANAMFHVFEERFSESLDEFRTAVEAQNPAATKASATKLASGKNPTKS